MEAPKSSYPNEEKFAYVYAEERAAIRNRRSKLLYDDGTRNDPKKLPDQLVGLALSGGGIRSATFCLGFLQELHRLKLLRVFDYMSTVSGGGYVGAWWSAWLARKEGSARAHPEDPEFKDGDILHPATFVSRIKRGEEPLCKALRAQMRRNKTYELLAKTKDDSEPSLELLRALIEELNEFLKTPAPVQTVIRPGVDEPPEPAIADDSPENLWFNRRRLEQAFPYELQDIFPPSERIEPNRRFPKPTGKKESEGSLLAWEDPIHHLRLFANYLTPRKGGLSADTWRAVSVIMRNLVLTWLILLPILVAVMLLGQAYFLLNPLSRAAYLNETRVGSEAILIPIAGLVIWIVIMALAWLMCHRDSSSMMDTIAQFASLAAVLFLVGFAILHIPVLNQLLSVFDIIPQRARIPLLVGWTGLVLVIVCVMWVVKTPHSDPTASLLWRKEARRNRFSRAQAQLLVVTAVVATVLSLTYLTTLDLGFTFERVTPYKIPLTIFPALIALAGSIFTAFRATPVVNEEKVAIRDVSTGSRIVFAITPGLVIFVLAMLSAKAGRRVLLSFHNLYWLDPTGAFQSVSSMLEIFTMLAIVFCFALAVYELTDEAWSKLRELSKPVIVFLCLVMIDLSWGAQALFFSLSGKNYNDQIRLAVSGGIAFVTTMIVILKIFPNRQALKARIFELQVFKDIREKNLPVTAELMLRILSIVAGITFLFFLTGVGFASGKNIYFIATEKTPEHTNLFAAAILSFVSLAGGFILFRLGIMRQPDDPRRFRLAFQTSKLGERSEALWVLAAACVVFPLSMICLGHFLAHWGMENEPWGVIVFATLISAVVAILILLKGLVVRKRLLQNQPATEGAQIRLYSILDRIGLSKKYWRPVSIMLALVALGSPLFVVPASQGLEWAPLNFTVKMGEGYRLNGILLAIGLLINLLLLGLSFLEASPPPISDPAQPRTRLKWFYRNTILWALAFLCVSLLLVAGGLVTTFATHVSHIPLTKGLIPILLPAATGCFLFVVFEMWFGQEQNRRSLWLISFAYLGCALLFFLQLLPPERPWAVSLTIIVGLLAGVCVWVGALGWMVDPNSVSMHQFYRGRLVGAYLGASNLLRRKQGNKEITENVFGDDLPLQSLATPLRGAPYHIINTTLNLVGGRDLATAQRSASSFILSQKFCGSRRTGYRPTSLYMNGQLSVGTAIATSGAAVSPNMGSRKPTAALAMLMTLLNVRLGYWAPTPNKEAWKLSQPRLWPFYLIREFLSQTNDVSTYCYLTDGGHFDNTGLYSLIERGCRYIVLVDCGADPHSKFQDLGEAIRRCRIDFGTEIDLTLDNFMGARSNVQHCVVAGTVTYSCAHINKLEGSALEEEIEAHKKLRTGTILYIKPSLVKGVSADVRQYWLENDDFPQQTTANQWFDEAQFESYRQLGQLCAGNTFDIEHVREFAEKPRLSPQVVQDLFEKITKAASTGAVATA